MSYQVGDTHPKRCVERDSYSSTSWDIHKVDNQCIEHMIAADHTSCPPPNCDCGVYLLINHAQSFGPPSPCLHSPTSTGPGAPRTSSPLVEHLSRESFAWLSRRNCSIDPERPRTRCINEGPFFSDHRSLVNRQFGFVVLFVLYLLVPDTNSPICSISMLSSPHICRWSYVSHDRSWQRHYFV